jgi:hypothetical protein
MIDTVPVAVMLKVNDLVIDTTYQKNTIRKKLVQRITNNLNPALLGHLVVNQRKGTKKYYVIDGQHRMLALRALKISDVVCVAYFGLSAEEEAELFQAWNNSTSRSQTTNGENFRARIISGDSIAIAINNLVYHHDLNLYFNRGGAYKNTIGSVATLEEIYIQMGPIVLGRSLGLLKATWDGNATTLRGVFIDGVSCFVNLAGDLFKDDDFISKFKKIDPDQILREAEGIAKYSKSKSLNFAKHICFYYNKNRKFNNIPEELFITKNS